MSHPFTGRFLGPKNAPHPLIKLSLYRTYLAEMQGKTLSSHRPYICLNRHGGVLVGFRYIVDIVPSDFWYLFELFGATNLVNFYVTESDRCG